jgi:hypothetical protein
MPGFTFTDQDALSVNSWPKGTSIFDLLTAHRPAGWEHQTSAEIGVGGRIRLCMSCDVAALSSAHSACIDAGADANVMQRKACACITMQIKHTNHDYTNSVYCDFKRTRTLKQQSYLDSVVDSTLSLFDNTHTS